MKISEIRKEPIKAFFPGEAMWVLPIKYIGAMMLGRIDNFPFVNHGALSYGDICTFRKAEDGAWEFVGKMPRQTKEAP